MTKTMSIFIRFHLALTIVILFGVGYGVLPKSASANPNTDAPAAAIKAHGTIDGAKQRVEQMYAKFDEWETMASGQFEKLAQRGKISHAKLSSVFVDLHRGIWFSQDLVSMGEPAGKDLEIKFRALHLEFRKFPSILGPFQQKKIQELRKLTPKRQKALAQINQMVKAGKVVEAAGAIQKLHLSQLQSVFYLTNRQASEFESPVGGLHNQVLALLAKQRKEQFKKQALSNLDQHKAAIDQFQSEAKRIVDELSKNGKVSMAVAATGAVDNKTGDAADAIAYVGTLWGNCNAAINRSFGVALAYQSGMPSEIDDVFESDLERSKSLAVETISRVLLTMGKADTDELLRGYPRILSQLSALDRRYYGNLQSELTEPLETLAKLNSDLAGYSSRYAQATAEPMRWMKRFAMKQAASVAATAPETASLLDQKLPPNLESRPAFYPRVGSRERVLASAQFGQPASWTVGFAKALIGKKVRQADILRLIPDRELYISPQTSRHYVNISGSIDIEKEIEFVKDSLLIDPNHAALEWSAANAISSTDMREFAIVGGTIKRLSMESLVSRIATIPDVASALVPLDTMAEADSNGSHFDRSIWRVDVAPEWVAHPLFVVQAR